MPSPHANSPCSVAVSPSAPGGARAAICDRSRLADKGQDRGQCRDGYPQAGCILEPGHDGFGLEGKDRA